MQLIDRFHQMESENALFELGEEQNIPIWDIIRYHVYIKYYYPEKDRKYLSVTPEHSISEYFNLIKQFFIFIYRVIFCKGENVFLTASRYINDNNEYFDISALSIIKTAGINSMVIEAILCKKTTYKYIYDFSCILRRFYFTEQIHKEYFTKINDVLLSCFGASLITYDEVNTIINDFMSDYRFYKTIFALKKTKKLFISTGNPKASLLAAKKLNIKTYLIQHAGIEFDEVDYSYPKGITPKSTILFPQYLLTYGDYWCRNMNVPSQEIIPIGNDFFYTKPNIQSDGSILIISTIIHGGELSRLTKELANLREDLRFIYKLHPNEFQLQNQYLEYFKNNANVRVLTNDVDTSILIAKSQLLIIIVSAVIYEALNQNKKVLIYKKINYERQLALSQYQNVYFFDSISEAIEVLSKKSVQNSVDFFKETDYKLINAILRT